MRFKLSLLIVLLWVLSASAVIVRVYSLGLGAPGNPFLFWVPYAILIFCSGLIALQKRTAVALLFIVGMSLVLHMINFVRQPQGFLLEIDAASNFEVASKLVQTSHLPIGYPGFTSIAFSGSFYPGFEIFLSSLNVVSGIHLSELYKWAMAIVNVSVILFFYFLLKRIVADSRVVNLALFLYALCPMFQGFDSYAVHESLGIIFYPLLIGVFLTERDKLFSSQKFAVMVFVFVAMLSFTHHLTMYMLILQSIVVLAFSLIMSRNVSFHQARMFFFAVISLIIWQLYNASYVIYTHSKIPIAIAQALFLEHSSEATTVAPDSMSLLERNSVYFGIGLLAATSILGVLVLRREGEDYFINTSKWGMTAWWMINAGLLVLFFVIPWGAIDPAVRFRDLEFVYFGVALFSSVGICRILDWDKKTRLISNERLKLLKKTTVLLMLFALAIPTILIGFRYYVYDNPGPKVSDYSYPVESYYSAVWLANNAKFDHVTGSSGGRDYVAVPALVEFDYTSFASSIRTRVLLNDPYWINKANLFYPDESNFTLSGDDKYWLDSNLNTVYDNGAIEILIPVNPH